MEHPTDNVIATTDCLQSQTPSNPAHARTVGPTQHLGSQSPYAQVSEQTPMCNSFGSIMKVVKRLPHPTTTLRTAKPVRPKVTASRPPKGQSRPLRELEVVHKSTARQGRRVITDNKNQEARQKQAIRYVLA